ncbi:type II toxin-antitoxin system VapB family antitoxin [Roseinatronobacter monicus]|uniref:Antitoxin VapB n=1 Tax=Roseinatronobacter monicus TaxID=393481 RepID=A0A543K3C0_9RHOB|nr:type II toxin-antitoxin system VapB family antitoxin [Roseinatronobacter monicus]TQM89567.1 antitoxin VapB [Roseinatronobacter monicus]
MPLFIRNPEVDTLVDKVMAATGSKDKTETVRKALLLQLEAVNAKESLASRVAKVQQKAALTGLRPDGRDDKDLMDEQWGV